LKNLTPDVFINAILICGRLLDALMMLQERLLIRTWSSGSTRGLTCLIDLVTLPPEGLWLAMLVLVKIWNCHGNRLRAGLAVWMPLTEAWTSTSLTGRCGRLVTLSDENRGTSGVRSPDEHSNKIRTTSCRSGSSCAVWVSSGGTKFLTMDRSARMRHPPPRLRAASEGGAGAARAPVSDPSSPSDETPIKARFGWAPARPSKGVLDTMPMPLSMGNHLDGLSYARENGWPAC